MHRRVWVSHRWLRRVAAAWVIVTSNAVLAGNLPMVVTSEADREAALTMPADVPLRYAVGLSPSLTKILAESGGVSVFSPGAHSLGLRLRLHRWPANVPLAWRSEQMDAPHSIDPGSGESQWLPDVPGDIATLTWQSEGLPEDAALELELIYHGYRTFHGPQARVLGSADSCNVDVACSEGDDWALAARATVMLSVSEGSSRARCSGALLNNTANDDRPLLITARHCGVNSSNADSVIATFNFQRSVCGGSNDGVSTNTLSGSQFLGESIPADTTLLVLDQAIPGAYAAHLGGWSAQPIAPNRGAGLHHPNGDQKKISLFEMPATTADGEQIGGGADSFTVDAWEVRWNSGTTEVGSSGSGLWNQGQQLVGVLSGGTHSCSNRSGDDLYGRLPVAWDTSPAIRMALDPVGEGTARVMEGRDASLNQPSPTTTPSPSPAPSVPPPVDASGGGGTGIALYGLMFGLFVRRLIRRGSGWHFSLT